MSLPKPTLTTLGKLIPRLGSIHPDEVTATVAAICRTLHGAGADLTISLMRSVRIGRQNGSTRFCSRRWDLLSERERSLIESLERWRGTPTDKQLAFLRNVFTRITRLASAS
jgi:hypothetical protein